MSNKVVIITGASRGLGLTLVKEFAAQGWDVIGTGRSEQPNGLPEGATYQQFDAGDAKACASFWKQLDTVRPDAEICLINNAGGYVGGGLLTSKPEDYAAMMASAYFTSVYMTRALAEAVSKARILNIVSTSALAPEAANPAYGAAKAAQRYFFESLQQEFLPERYQITNIYPSDIATHGANARAIDPSDLANFIRELAENAASFYVRDVTLYPQKA